MKAEEGGEAGGVAAASTATATTPAGEGGAGGALRAMNEAFAKCLALVSPPIQYPPHCRLNPVQQDAADTLEVETRLEEFFLHAKQLELLLLGTQDKEGEADATATDTTATTVTAGRALQQRSELELEILNLEAELSEKNDLIEKYADVARGWEGKFKRLDHRLAPERE